MFILNFITFLVLITCSFALKCSPKLEDNTSINCSVQRRCSFIEDIVWATDNKQCYLFRNPCLFANEICSRRDRKQEELKVVTQEECKKYCPEFCTEEYDPVCGEYDNELKTFSNKCDFYRHSCQNSKSYILSNEGECNQAVSA